MQRKTLPLRLTPQATAASGSYGAPVGEHLETTCQRLPHQHLGAVAEIKSGLDWPHVFHAHGNRFNAVFGRQWQVNAQRPGVGRQDRNLAPFDINTEPDRVEDLPSENDVESVPEQATPDVAEVDDRHGLIG